MTFISKKYAVLGAMFTTTAIDASQAFAAAPAGLTPVTTTTYKDESFSTIFERITTSFGGLPGLISMFCYVLGIIFAITGILKIKAHVENPDKQDLKGAAIFLIVGGALFALPYLMDVMTATIGDQSQSVEVNTLKKASFGVN